MDIGLIQAIHRAPRNSLTVTECGVLIALAACRNRDTLECFPSIRKLADMAHVSERAVNYALKALKRRGLVDYGKRKTKSGWVNAYYFPTFDQ